MNFEEIRDRLEFLSRQLEIGIDIMRRTIIIDTEIDIMTPNTLKSKIFMIMDATGSKDPITLDISSYGGSVEGLFGCIDIINSVEPLINTRAIGAAMSAAGLLVIAGTGTRSMGPHATLMLHEISSTLKDGVGNLSLDIEHLTLRTEQAAKILALKSNKTLAYWKKSLNNNQYLTATQCLELGLIDKLETNYPNNVKYERTPANRQEST